MKNYLHRIILLQLFCCHLLNQVSAQFLPPIIVDSLHQNTGFMYDLKVGDLNNDGLPDILTARGNPNRIEIHFNAGNNNYDSAIQVNHGLALPRGLVITDVDFDGLNDIVFITDSGDIKYFKQLNDGFDLPRRIDQGRTIQSFGAIISEDLNGDNLEDLLVLEHFHPTLYKHNADGTFAAGQVMIDSSEFTEIYAITTGHFNGDGLKDIVFGAGGYHIYHNQGSMQFVLDSNYFDTLIFGLEADGLDGSAYDDILIKSSSLFKSGLINNNGIFSTLKNFDPPTFNYTDFKPIRVSDDTNADVAAIYNQFDNVVWFENDGNGNFSSEKIIASFKGSFMSKMAVHDMNGDGLEDIIYGGSSILGISLQGETVSNHNISQSQISIYPNPASEEINIKSFYDKIETIHVIDFLGKVQISANDTNQINLENLVPGTYILKWFTGKDSGKLPFIKI